jgi:osmoprotectant transport system permease protein
MNLFSDIRQFFENSAAYHSGDNAIGTRLIQHCEYSLIALVIAAVIALPFSILSGHSGRGDGVISAVAVVGRAMPSLGLLVLLTVEWGISITITMIPLVLLGIPPILLYTQAGIRAVDPAAVDAARGLGMTPWQTIRKVELPAALPLILAGLRGAAVQIVATATLAAVVSFGGLGRYIIDGLSQYDYVKVVGGAVLVAGLTLVTLFVFWLLDRLLVSPGLRTR